MPKPVLSDSLFNADDVATAVLSEANLQITNQNLGVTDRSSIFVKQSTIDTLSFVKAFDFNGFMFLQLFMFKSSLPSSATDLVIINDSNFYLSYDAYGPIVSYQGDVASFVKITTSGGIQVIDPTSAGDSLWRGTINMWYRFA